jgi:hypothetical protein
MSIKITKTSFIIILFTIILYQIQMGSFIESSAAINNDELINQEFSWTINEINEGANQWYNSTSWLFVGSWHAETGQKMNFSAKELTTINDHEFLVGEFSIGNLSITTHNHDIGINLVLSSYPWVGGLIILDLNPTALATITPFNGSEGSVKTIESYTFNDQQFEVVNITYNDSFQVTQLLYEKKTGILLHALTGAGNFNLELKLDDSSITLPTASISLFNVVDFFLYTGLLIVPLRLLLREKQKS